mgnify:CR=1 FL=1
MIKLGLSYVIKNKNNYNMYIILNVIFLVVFLSSVLFYNFNSKIKNSYKYSTINIIVDNDKLNFFDDINYLKEFECINNSDNKSCKVKLLNDDKVNFINLLNENNIRYEFESTDYSLGLIKTRNQLFAFVIFTDLILTCIFVNVLNMLNTKDLKFMKCLYSFGYSIYEIRKIKVFSIIFSLIILFVLFGIISILLSNVVYFLFDILNFIYFVGLSLIFNIFKIRKELV